MMKLGNISFAGKSFRDFGVKIALCKNRYDMPKPNISAEHVDGRNGDMLFYTDDFDNVDLNYLCICKGDFDTEYNALKSWIYSLQGYYRLEDDAYPDEYRMAYVKKEPSIENARDCFTIEFNCKPQKFLKAGEEPIELSQTGSIYNPTDYTAKPLIKVVGTGQLIIGNTVMRIDRNDSYMMLDCEYMDAYREQQNLNSDITLITGNFFTLEPGKIDIAPAQGMTIQITPRWWKL